MMRSLISFLLASFLLISGPAGVLAQSPSRKDKPKPKHPASPPCRSGCKPASAAPWLSAETAEEAALQKELSDLAHNLRTSTPGSYEKLSAFASKHTTSTWGARGALALGYEDYSRSRGAQALGWFLKAQNDDLLREYAVFWSAQAQRGLGRPAEAYKTLLAFRHDYPNSALREQLLEAFAPTAVQLGHSEEALDALNAYSGTPLKSTLLLERARAYQAAHQLARAAKEFQTLYYKFPLTDEAKPAGQALVQLTHALGKEYPYPGVEMQESRAQSFYDARKWREALPEYQKLQTMLKDPANPARQHSQLRISQCRVQLKASPSVLAALKLSDPEVDAERLYALSQAYRSAKKPAEMFSALGTLSRKYPATRWNEDGLMAAGNYYWVELDRANAVASYQRLLDAFPSSKHAFNCEWRIAWVALLNRQADAEERLSAFLVKNPVSANSVDALYWLGRVAERRSDAPRARAYYSKAVDRFPLTYFGHAAQVRLASLPPGESARVELLEKIPPPPVLRSLDDPIPAAAADRWARAMALRSIAFDSAAELELKNAFFATASPRFLLQAAQAAFDQGHFGAGMAYARTAIPSFDSRKFDELPIEAWKALFPLPYEAALRREAAKNSFDPMFAAGLIRQESTFQADAVSHANAIGLMQVLPKTGRLLAKQIKVRYSKDKLFQPDFNIALGMVYIANLLRLTGSPEYAAAAYNAGEDRIALWKGERNYEEIPEVVESIPFTETREYVQIVLRNTYLYRMIYGQQGVSTASAGGLAR